MMRINITAILVGFLLMTVAAVFMATTLAVAGLSGFVTAQSGVVEVQRGGKGVWTRLSAEGGEPARVLVGDKLRTGPSSRVELNWADGTRMALDPSSQLTVRKYRYDSKGQNTRQQSLFHLELGKVWARVSHTLTAESRFELETPHAVAGVRGTIFAVTANGDETAVSVFDGQVNVAARSGQTSEVAAGKQITVTGHGLAEGKIGANELDAWRAQTILLPSLRFRPTIKGRLRGQAEPGASVTVNGQAVEVAPDGSFSAKPDGATATVVVTDKAGHQRTGTWPQG